MSAGQLAGYPRMSSSRWNGRADYPPHWAEQRLSRLLRFGNGADYKEVEDPDGPYLIYGSGGPFARSTSWLYDGESVLFGRKGTIDRPLHVSGRFWTVDTMYYTVIDRCLLLPRFLYYWATRVPFGYYQTNTALPSMTQSDLGSEPIALPPMPEQVQIAEYLDFETGEIDAFIADQERLIDLLTERRQAAVAEAVSTFDGTPTRRLKYLFRQSRAQNPGGLPVLSVYRDFGVIPKASRSDNFNKTPEDLDRYLLVEPGDLVVNKMKAWQGSLGVSEYDGIVSGDYEVLTPTSHLADPRYVHWVLRSAPFVSEFRRRSSGIRPAQWRLYWDELGNIELPLPTPKRQEEFAQRLRQQVADVDAAITDAREAMALSRERRAALISAAVTGKIDVRDWAPPKAG